MYVLRRDPEGEAGSPPHWARPPGHDPTTEPPGPLISLVLKKKSFLCGFIVKQTPRYTFVFLDEELTEE